MPLRLAPRGTGGRSPKNAKIKIRKNQNFKNCKIKNKNFENFHRKFVFREIDLEIVWQDPILVLKISGKTFASSSPFAPFAMCEVHI
jgi:hypothetical protein